MKELTEIRKSILNIIEKNSRIELKELAVLSGLSEMEVANEIKDMEKEGIISGYHTLINWENTSEEKVTAMIEVMVTPQRGQGFDKIAERIYNFSEVKSIYLMSGGYDFIILLEEKTMRAVSQFVSEKLSPLEAVRGTATHFVLKKYKDHGTILNESKTDERMLVTP
jgi:DNA-binding Lrp family transcriptional regulator